MIHLAYDGSLNGDWVSRYAIRMAAHTTSRELTLVHVTQDALPEAALGAKLDQIADECEAGEVQLRRRFVPLDRTVFHTLRHLLPAGVDDVTVCGTRVRPGGKGYLGGTVSEKLLAQRDLQVMAVRVVEPGQLGNPRRFLLPLSGHPRGVEGAWPFFERLLPEADEVHVLRVMMVGPLWRPHLSERREKLLLEQGRDYVQAVLDAIAERCPQNQLRADGRVLISDDWVREILVQANELKARMILMGASERMLISRLLSNPLERVLRDTPCDVAICSGR